jgi:cation diffusion facilitator family transporter
MSPTATHEELRAPQKQTPPDGTKRSAALLSVLAAAVITLLKLVAGLATGSLGMLSESAHSGIDLIASAITLFSVQAADRPADEEHNYGHGKIESLSAFAETFIMLASCIWLVSESIGRIAFHQHLELRPSIWPFLVLALSIVVDWTRSRTLGRIALEHRSDALAADAVHFATDMWASLAVMISLAATYAGERFALPWLEYADPLAAIAVAGVILHVSWRLARQTVDTLLDATPSEDSKLSRKETRNQLIHELAAIPGVLSVERLRTRRSGANYFADVTLGMPRGVTFQRSEQITMAATEAVQRHLPGADVVVHPVPTASIAENVHDRIRAVAAQRNLAIHEISVQQFDEHHIRPGIHVEQHLEVDETMPLRQAHALVTELEAGMRREVPEISSILTHIESEPATIERPASLERDQDLELRLRRVAAGFPEILDIHDVFVTRRGPHPIHLAHISASGSSSSDDAEDMPGYPADHLPDHIQVSCHCTLSDDLPMARVHAVITALEGAFKLDAPEVDRLLIHPEPATDNRR